MNYLQCLYPGNSGGFSRLALWTPVANGFLVCDYAGNISHKAERTIWDWRMMIVNENAVNK